MIASHKTRAFLLSVTAIVIATVLPASGSVLPENKVSNRVESKAIQLEDELTRQGFQVNRGYFKLWTIEDCNYTASILGMCYGNNPAAPYVIMTLPPWPEEEYVDPVTSNIWGPSAIGYNDSYRFYPREAIVILGLLPPQASYFSQQTWLFTREGQPGIGSPTYYAIKDSEILSPFLNMFFAESPGNDKRTSDRTQALSSISNIVNNVVIERQSGAAFNQVRYFIITPDQVMDREVRKAFASISVEDRDVFTERIPSDMRIGLESSADDFSTWIRYAHPRDGGRPGTPSDTWRNELPLAVFRVRDTSDREPQKYPPVDLDVRRAVDERSLEPDLENLLFAVSRKWGQPCANTDCSDRAKTFSDLQADPTNMVGPSCISTWENCLFDTQDASYQLYGQMSLDDGEVYAVAGALGTETGNATYVGMGINQLPIMKGVANLYNEDLRGTAKEIGRGVNNTQKLYLYYFTRDCSGLEGLTRGNCLPLTEDLIPKWDQFAITIRNYIKPGTLRGPDSSLLLPSMILKLQRH